MQERRVAEAWIQEGRDGEWKERIKLKEEKDQENFKTWQEIEKRKDVAEEKRKIYLEQEKDKSQIL